MDAQRLALANTSAGLGLARQNGTIRQVGLSTHHFFLRYFFMDRESLQPFLDQIHQAILCLYYI